MASAKQKAATPRPTLLDRVDALAIVDQFIAEHGDEILANGGALSPALAELLDTAEGEFADKLAAIDVKQRLLRGDEASNKAVAAAFTQKAKVTANARDEVMAWAHRGMVAAGREHVQTPHVNARIQNSPASLDHAYDAAQLLAIADSEPAENGEAHPLARFLTVQRAAVLDGRALLAAYLAREAALRDEANDVTEVNAATRAAITRALDEEVEAMDAAGEERPTVEQYETERAARCAQWLRLWREGYVRDTLAAEFPGVRVARGTHLRFY